MSFELIDNLQVVRFLTVQLQVHDSLFSMLLCYFLLYLTFWAGLQYCRGYVYIFSSVDMSFSIDSYSNSFYSLLGVISFVVVLWSYYYIDNEPVFNRFLILLYFFILFMIFLIFFDNLYITLIGWDGLGVTSFLLVIYYKNRKSLGSGLITALSNRIGDSLFFCLLGFLILSRGYEITLLLLIFMSITKSAQWPFSAWLPSAMAAPTPVSALVHSSTLVTAGLYVLLRYCHTDGFFLLAIGSWTILMAGIVACCESDLKNVVALSTLSQIGIIIVSIGAQENSFCFFHLISHAYFNALLFLCVGFGIHTVYGGQDFRSYNEISLTIIPAVLYVVSILSLMGFCYTAGFYSNETILVSLIRMEGSSWSVLCFLLGIGLTTFYSFNSLMIVLLGGLFSGVCTISIGGGSWFVKIPLFTLGCFSIIWGVTNGTISSPLSVSLLRADSILPILLIGVGSFLGSVMPSLCSPTVSSIGMLVPLSQLSAKSVVLDLVNPVDKGWVHLSVLSLSMFRTSLISHFSLMAGMGLSVLLLFIL